MILICVYVSVCHVYAGTQRDKRVPDYLELQFQAV